MPKRKALRSSSGSPPEGSPRRAESVFINCPFDADYEQNLDAVILATVCCGFYARSAIEAGRPSDLRLDRIQGALFSSKYSIHDLSRCRGEGKKNLARFNMPLELGMAMTLRYVFEEQRDERYEHEWVVLVPEGHEYLEYVSDLGGIDPYLYDRTPEDLVTAVMLWLLTLPEAEERARPSAVCGNLSEFERRMSKLRTEFRDRTPPWKHRLEVATDIATSL